MFFGILKEPDFVFVKIAMINYFFNFISEFLGLLLFMTFIITKQDCSV